MLRKCIVLGILSCILARSHTRQECRRESLTRCTFATWSSCLLCNFTYYFPFVTPTVGTLDTPHQHCTLTKTIDTVFPVPVSSNLKKMRRWVLGLLGGRSPGVAGFGRLVREGSPGSTGQHAG